MVQTGEMSMERWWNGTDGGKPKFSLKTLSECHFVHLKFHWTALGSNQGAVRGRLLTARTIPRPFEGPAFVSENKKRLFA